MKSSADLLGRLHIASPCRVGWEQMTGDDRIRLCAQCDLHVYNIAEMTRKEAASLIANTEVRVCAKIYRRADGTIITRDCPVGLRAIRRRMLKTTAAVFAAVVSVCATAFGHGRVNLASSFKSQVAAGREPLTLTPQPISAMVGGTITDPNSDPIKGAIITLINLRTNQKQVTKSDKKGQYHFLVSEFGPYSFKVEASYFRIYERDLALHLSDDLRIDVSLMIGAMVGIVTLEEPKRSGFDLDGVHIRINEK